MVKPLASCSCYRCKLTLKSPSNRGEIRFRAALVTVEFCCMFAYMPLIRSGFRAFSGGDTGRSEGVSALNLVLVTNR